MGIKGTAPYLNVYAVLVICADQKADPLLRTVDLSLEQIN
jgi:hypothetical protein